jgi:endonuclease/exonuclease/phosphatase family metal-dependent hydrolase
VPEQAVKVAEVQPDVVCLQEVTDRARPLWERALRLLGLEHVADPPALGPAETKRGRRLAVLVAAREPFAAAPVPGVPWPERALAARFAGGLLLVGVHSPISATPALVKVRTHEALHAYLSGLPAGPRVLCGDLNTPRREHPDGTVWTFARDRYGRLREERGERWEQAELALIRGLEPFGYRDAFRALHGYAAREPTWEWPRWGGGYRLDHLIVSAEVAVDACRYAHEWRREGLSDHSGLLAELRIRPESGGQTQSCPPRSRPIAAST